jgi:hypothetical protein
MSTGPVEDVFGMLRVIAPLEWMVSQRTMLEYKQIIDIVRYKNWIYERVL